MSDKAELGIFLAAMSAASSSRGNRQKSQQGKLCGQRCRTNINPAVSLSKKKGAVIGRAAGGAYRPLKKLNRVCELRGSPVALLGVLFCGDDRSVSLNLAFAWNAFSANRLSGREPAILPPRVIRLRPSPSSRRLQDK